MSEEVKVGNRTYALGSILGVGGFSEVCKGVDNETRKRVALKIMYSDKQSRISEQKQQLIQVQKEIKAMKQLNHANLIRLLGYDLKCQVKGRKAIVMVQQLAPKGELFDYLMYTKKFEENQASALFKQLIAGLTAMHNVGIAHRDLKPENVLFDNQFNLKLADFGFAYVFQKGEGAKTSMRTELGTKGYMAPEIINNKKYTEKADIFAAGVILFIMLAGFPPFQNATAKDWWFDKLMKGKFKLFWMAHERTAKFSPDAKDILQKMLAPKEADRLDVFSITETKFWNNKCLTKDELTDELQKRKKVVDLEKKETVPSRDTLLEIMIPKGSLLPGSSPVLLKSLLNNPFVDGLKTTSTKDVLTQSVLEVASTTSVVKPTEVAKVRNAMRDAFNSLSDEKAAEVAKLLSESQKDDTAALLEKLNVFFETEKLDETLVEIISKALKSTDVGVLDDFDVVEKMAKLDDEVKIPDFEVYKMKANSYRTKMSFGLLAYCLQKFVKGRGKMSVNTAKATVQLLYHMKKQLVLPHENKQTGEVTWKKGAMALEVVVNIQLCYDRAHQINVLTFENASASHMSMQEYAAIVKEVTENYNWVLPYFLEGAFEHDDKHLEDTIIDENDIITEDGDGEAEEEEVTSK